MRNCYYLSKSWIAHSTRNFNKRIKMQENNVKNFKPIFYYQKDQIGILENENVKINWKSKEAWKVSVKARKQNYYLSNKLDT